MPGSLVYKQTVKSEKANDDPEMWGPEVVDYIFTARAECQQTSCKEGLIIAGIGGLEPVYEENQDGGIHEKWEPYFSPTFVCPMPDIFNIPPKCHDDVKDELRAAFSLFRSNRAACAGRIRVALECLMNYLEIPKRRRNKRGRYSVLTLHGRIDAFADAEPVIGRELMQ